jgi:redox-sensing transcriptional repressor
MDRVTQSGKRISEPALRRLAGYYRHFRDLETRGVRSVSCVALGDELSLDPTLVRKDLESIAIVGRRRVGFAVADLLAGIERRLGYNDFHRTFLVGAGTLGTALLKHWKFQHYGLEIVAAFDIAPARVGEEIGGLTVQHLRELPGFAGDLQPQLGIITVPAEEAQCVADLLVGNGIGAIWNFAPVNLRVPSEVIVQNEDLYRSLATLSHRLVLKHEGAVGKFPPA